MIKSHFITHILQGVAILALLFAPTLGLLYGGAAFSISAGVALIATPISMWLSND